ncbi:hypothetical protein SORBI_3006G189801 [Sorghum bicolor]|uniref:Secreted protein n=1 Tax=Sorghum bicolor TaxID=4558 RepID=A0A1Z5REM8_SORBI|nr:hypothetical protein SORBI_3006G189801 [Sorghum bicolor]
MVPRAPCRAFSCFMLLSTQCLLKLQLCSFRWMLCHRGVSGGCFAAEVRCFATKDASPAGGSLRLLRWGRMLGRRMVALPLRTRLRLGWSSRLLKWRRMLGRRLVRFATEDASGWVGR